MIDYFKFDVMFFDEVIAYVDLKPSGSDKPYVINYIEGFNKQFSPKPEGNITIVELEKWLKWRVFPETRVNADELLAALGLNSYNRWAIVRKTHGVMADDEIWLRFKGETLKHRDVTLRKSLYYPDSPSI
ncbi:hypothetical protein PQ478_21520 (plasmid) [Alkalihalophilus pseudofirmus]|uniref:hypothetical protein n=1 Tax=Alkalihalophilus pseudofirmus TaxID=79885 RepID=UPI00259BCF7A|nr:hypothetical protein [Alkalihalophilus pseudofirmus]WEG19268.1 hypothetical protein PQ478_21520 [Alkalihalophilus pseudofirmus]